MRLSAWISLPKDADFPKANEDWFKASSDGQLAVLCDGASESFDSKLWAECLGRAFLRLQTLDLATVLFAKRQKENLSSPRLPILKVSSHRLLSRPQISAHRQARSRVGEGRCHGVVRLLGCTNLAYERTALSMHSMFQPRSGEQPA
jgi:hypothetical protein